MKAKLSAANVTAFVIGALALIGALVLTALHDAVPGYVWAIALAGVTAGAGLSVPGGTLNASTDFADVAAVLPQLVADFNKAVPGAVTVEEVAAEILRQVAASSTPPAASSTPAPAPIPAALLAPANVLPGAPAAGGAVAS